MSKKKTRITRPVGAESFERIPDTAIVEVPFAKRQQKSETNVRSMRTRSAVERVSETPPRHEQRTDERLHLNSGTRPPGARASEKKTRPPQAPVVAPPVVHVEPVELPEPGSLGDGALVDFNDAEVILLASVIVSFSTTELHPTAKRLYQEVLYQMQRRALDFTVFAARLAERANVALQKAYDADLLREVQRAKDAVRRGRG